MTVHDAAGAAARLMAISVDGYAPGRNHPGECLRWSYFAQALYPNLSPASIAMDAWNYAPAEHRHLITASTVVPAGLPIILGPSPTRTDANAHAGDVYEALGVGAGFGNLGPMTDSPRLGAGRIGVASLGERMAQTRRPVKGYLTWWLGYELISGHAPTTVTPTTALVEEPMTDYSLVRKNGHPEVYLSVDRMTRRHIATEAALRNVLAVLAGAGGNAAACAKRGVDVVNDLDAYGVDVTGLDGLTADASLSTDQINAIALAVAPVVGQNLATTLPGDVANVLAARLAK